MKACNAESANLVTVRIHSEKKKMEIAWVK